VSVQLSNCLSCSIDSNNVEICSSCEPEYYWDGSDCSSNNFKFKDKLLLACLESPGCKYCGASTKDTFICDFCFLGYYNHNSLCHRNKLKEDKRINFLGCPDNCERCIEADTCFQCHPGYNWDPIQLKCRSKISNIRFKHKLFSGCLEFNNCLFCLPGTNGLECAQCESKYFMDDNLECQCNH